MLVDDQARDLSNVQGTTAGAIVKRNGLVTFASPANTLTSLFALESIANPVLVGSGSTFLYSVTTGGVVTQIQSALTNNARWEFISAPIVSGQGPCFGMNGVDTPQRWDGVAGTTSAWTNASGGVAVPNGKYLLYANNQAFVSGVAAFPSRVYWSALADPTNWDPASLTGAGSADFDPNDGQAISGIGRVGPYILVCKPRKLWILVDPATPVIRRLADNVGCVSHRSIASGPEGTFFLSEDRGVYVTNGTKLTPISDKIVPLIQTAQPSLLPSAAGSYFAGHYYLSMSLLGGATNDTMLDYDATLQSWWKHSIGSNQLALWHLSSQAQLMSAKATSAIVDRCFVPNTTTDNGQNFTWVWRGPWQSPTFYRRRRFPTPWMRKRMRQIRIDGSGTIDFSLARDFTTTETLVSANILGTNPAADLFAGTGNYAAPDGTVFGGSPTVGRSRIYGRGDVANAWSLVFSGTSNTQDMVLAYVLMLADRRDLIVS